VVAVIVLGTVLLTLVTLAASPAPPTSAGGPTADPTHVVPPPPQLLLDGQACLVDFDRALDDRMICAHDLGPVWGYDTGGPAGYQARVLCSNGTQVFGDPVPHPAPRYLDDGRRRAQEWLKVFPSAAQARTAFDALVDAKPCGADRGAVAVPLTGPVIPLGAQAAMAYSLDDATASSDVMLLLVDDAVIQVAVTPLTNVPHDPDVLQLVALTAVARYLHKG
jgi:hypothetical protein